MRVFCSCPVSTFARNGCKKKKHVLGTATLLESARVTPSAALPIAGSRADSSGFVPVQAIPAQARAIAENRDTFEIMCEL